MQYLRFEVVLGRYGIELLKNNLNRLAVTPADYLRINCTTYLERIGICALKGFLCKSGAQ